MLKGILEPVLERFGRATALSAPTRYELVLGHVGYGIGFALIAGVAARLEGYAAPVGVGQIIGTVGLAAALGFLFLFWAVSYRSVPPDLWFFSHLVWLSLSYSFLFLWVAAAALCFVVILLFVLAVPPLAAAVVYGPMVAAGLIMVWFTWRVLRGYIAYLRGDQVGPVIRRPPSSGAAAPNA